MRRKVKFNLPSARSSRPIFLVRASACAFQWQLSIKTKSKESFFLRSSPPPSLWGLLNSRFTLPVQHRPSHCFKHYCELRNQLAGGCPNTCRVCSDIEAAFYVITQTQFGGNFLSSPFFVRQYDSIAEKSKVWRAGKSYLEASMAVDSLCEISDENAF